MAARATWKGFLKVSLVNIPIKVFPATESSGTISFNQLHGECQTRIQQKRWCPTCNKEVANTELVKGYEFEKGRYVVLTEEDMENVRPPSTRVIDLVQFDDATALDREFRKTESQPAPVLTGRLIRNRFVGDHNRVWHFGKCEDAQLNRAPYGLPGPRQWVDGSYGYFGNRRAMQELSIGLTYFMPYVGISLYEDVASSYLLQELGGTLRDRTMRSILDTVNDY